MTNSACLKVAIFLPIRVSFLCEPGAHIKFPRQITEIVCTELHPAVKITHIVPKIIPEPHELTSFPTSKGRSLSGAGGRHDFMQMKGHLQDIL